MELMLNLFLQV